MWRGSRRQQMPLSRAIQRLGSLIAAVTGKRITYHSQPDRLLPDGTPAVKGLGRKFSWSRFVNITPAQAEQLPEPDQIPCMCNDGGNDE